MTKRYIADSAYLRAVFNFDLSSNMNLCTTHLLKPSNLQITYSNYTLSCNKKSYSCTRDCKTSACSKQVENCFNASLFCFFYSFILAKLVLCVRFSTFCSQILTVELMYKCLFDTDTILINTFVYMYDFCSGKNYLEYEMRAVSYF